MLWLFTWPLHLVFLQFHILNSFRTFYFWYFSNLSKSIGISGYNICLNPWSIGIIIKKILNKMFFLLHKISNHLYYFKLVQGTGFEPAKAYTNRPWTYPLSPLGYPCIYTNGRQLLIGPFFPYEKLCISVFTFIDV